MRRQREAAANRIQFKKTISNLKLIFTKSVSYHKKKYFFQSLLKSDTELHEINESGPKTGHYFKDGKRKIDMIITYGKKVCENDYIKEKRRIFLSNLRTIGIEFEEAIGQDFSQSTLNQNENNNEEQNGRLIRFLKVLFVKKVYKTQ